MSHTGVDVIDFLFYTIYPVIGIFVVEAISRLIKAPKWIKLWVQAIISIGFWYILLVYFACTTELSANCNGDVLHLLLHLFIKVDVQKYLLTKVHIDFKNVQKSV